VNWNDPVSEASPWEDAVRWLIAQPGSADIVRDAYFDDPLLDAADRFWASTEWQAVRAIIGDRRGTALDVGAGRGIASYALARDGFAVTALEPDPSTLVGGGAIRALAAETDLPIAVVDTVTDPLPFADAQFDVVYARAVLHHIPDLAQAMIQFARVLKPGGVFIACREHVISGPAQLPAFLDGHPLHHRYGGEAAFTTSHYADMIRGAGLTLRQVLGPLASPINYGPMTKPALKAAIAMRGRRVPGGQRVIATALALPLVGDGLIALANRLDNRPGRHFTFVATRDAV
jgi:SAM-dependent methyltransferase